MRPLIRCPGGGTWFARLIVSLLAFFAVVPLRSQSTWTSRDIGSVGAAGSNWVDSYLQVTGSGADIWDGSDEFHFYSQPWNGDGEFVARLTIQRVTHGWAKAGLMFRESLAPESRNTMICATGENGTGFSARATTGGSTGFSGLTWQSQLPVWLKIVRTGESFTGYTSTDGRTWSNAGTTTLPGVPTTIYAGVAVTSHYDGLLSSAYFDNVSLARPSTQSGAPVITPRDPQTVHSGAVFTYQIFATNSPRRYTASGLPPGLTLNAETGTIVGVCSGSGSYVVALEAINDAGTGTASQTLVLTGNTPIEMPYIREVTPPNQGTFRVGEVLLIPVLFGNGYSPPFVTGTPRIALTIGGKTRYADYAWGSGTSTHAYAYTVQSDDVPATGLKTADTIDLNGGSIQDVYPLPCALATTSVNRPEIRFEVAASPTAAPIITTPEVINGRCGEEFSFQITATNAPTSYGLGIATIPSRPPGISFDPTTGRISGRLQTSGRYTLELRAANAAGTGTKSVTLEIPHVVTRVEMPPRGTYRTGDTLTFRLTFSSPAEITGVPSLGLHIAGRVRPAVRTSGEGLIHTFAYTVQPGDTNVASWVGVAPRLSLNGGLIKDAESGADFRVEVPRPHEHYGIVIEAPGGPVLPVITGPTTASATAGVPFSYSIVATNSPTSYATSQLPAGLTLNANTGVISGTAIAGTYWISLYATNDAGTATAQLVITVQPAGVSTWTSQDIGSVAAAGSSSDAGGMITVSGSGADIWDTSDEFHFRYMPLAGNGVLIARVTGMSNTHPWAKAGLMIRETLTPESRYYWVGTSGGNGTFAQLRVETGDTTQITPPSWNTSFPVWLRVQREGDSVSSWVSNDGVSWRWLSSWGWTNMPGTVYLGLAVTSHSDGVLCTATFDNVQFNPPPPSNEEPAAPTNLALSEPVPGQVTLTWTDNANNEARYSIERSTDNLAFAPLASTAANATRYDDTTVVSGMTYYYRLSAVSAADVGSRSIIGSITTQSAAVWNYADIGPVGVPGSNTSGTNTITIQGAGADIWGQTDSFRFVYRAVQGDFTVEAKVSSMTHTNGWAKAGVMVRESLEPGARNVFAFLTPDTLAASQIRRVSPGFTNLTGAFWGAAGHWVRIVRNGGSLTTHVSADGITWTVIETYDVALSEVVFVGFAVTSHDITLLNTAVFTDPSVQ